MYKVWRQAYNGLGKLREAAVLISSDISYEDALVQFTKGREREISVRNGNIYWLGLRLFNNEIDANNKIFDINECR